VGTKAVASDGNTYQWLGAQWGKINPATGKAGSMASKSIADELNQASPGGVAAPTAPAEPAAGSQLAPVPMDANTKKFVDGLVASYMALTAADKAALKKELEDAVTASDIGANITKSTTESKKPKRAV
jgi:hypothetical protein